MQSGQKESRSSHKARQYTTWQPKLSNKSSMLSKWGSQSSAEIGKYSIDMIWGRRYPTMRSFLQLSALHHFQHLTSPM